MVGVKEYKCPYCDTEFELETLNSFEAEISQDTVDNMVWESTGGDVWQSGETDGGSSGKF